MENTDWIGETIVSDAGWHHLERLVNVGDRMAGSAGEREAAEATRDALAEHARDARVDAFDVRGWTRGSSAVEADGESYEGVHECIALPHSPAGRVTGRLVDAGHGLPDDFEADLDGAVVVVDSDVPDWYDRYVHRQEKYARAMEAGAAAFVYRNHVEGCLPATGSVDDRDDGRDGVPAVGVSREVGARLRRRYEGEPVTVAVTAETDAATSRNVHAELGPETTEELLVTSHVDAHDIAEGAMDNGAGTAMLVEVARALAAREDELDTRVRFVAFGAEEVGLLGAEHEADRAALGDIRAVLNFDGVVRGRTLSMLTHGFDALGTAAEDVGDRLDHAVEISPKQGPHSDHWPFVRRGVPGYHVRSRADAAERGRGWGHTAADTLDKLDVRDLREQAVFLTELAVELADDGFSVAHASEADIAAALEAEDLAEGMRLTGEWPY